MPDIDLEQWRRVDALFSEALGLPPEERPEFLRTASGGNPSA